MTCIRFLAVAAAMAAFSVLSQPVEAAGGSWGGASSGGGYSSYGGSSGGSGGLFSRLKARHSSGGSLGSYGGASWGGSSGGSSWGSWGSSGGSVGRTGPLRRLVARIHARKMARRSRGSSGGWSGGSSGGSSGGRIYAAASHGGSSGGASTGGGSTGVSYSAASYSAPVVSSMSLGATAPYESGSVSPLYDSGGSIVQSGSAINQPIAGQPIIANPVMEQPVIGQPTDATAVPSETVGGETILDSKQYESAKPSVDSDAAMLTVSVPEDAVVTVNEHETTSDGPVRQFMSQGLKEGYVYTYVVKVIYDEDGEEKSESKEVKLRAGETKEVVFDTSGSSSDPTAEDDAETADSSSSETASTEQAEVVTVVRLHVPVDAQVTLAGNPTNGNGVVRTFRTNQLKVGEQWTNYTVRVVSDVNGESVTREKTIDVTAGSTNELTFNFGDTNKFAKR